MTLRHAPRSPRRRAPGSVCSSAPHSSPHSAMTTSRRGRLEPPATGTASILRTVSMLSASITRPNTTCLPSSHGVMAVVRKNWQPFVWNLYPLYNDVWMDK